MKTQYANMVANLLHTMAGTCDCASCCAASFLLLQRDSGSVFVSQSFPDSLSFSTPTVERLEQFSALVAFLQSFPPLPSSVVQSAAAILEGSCTPLIGTNIFRRTTEVFRRGLEMVLGPHQERLAARSRTAEEHSSSFPVVRNFFIRQGTFLCASTPVRVSIP
jgi:hypothetical protein